jgi:hypothetical protein
MVGTQRRAGGNAFGSAWPGKSAGPQAIVRSPPAWWHNLTAAGEAVAVVMGRRQPVRPRPLEGIERERAWAEMARLLPALDDYETFTEREFPFAVLEPTDE